MKKAYILIGVLGFALGIVIAQYFASDTPSNPVAGDSKTPVIPTKIGGDFTLMQDNNPMQLSDYQDKLVVMYFGFTSCPDVCPTSLAVIASALKELTPQEMAKVQPIFVSVDPQRDQGSQLMAYARHFHPSFIGITGEEDQVQKVANQYGAFSVKTNTDSAMGYMVEHTSETYLISGGGEEVTVLPHEMTKKSLLEAIRLGVQSL